MNDIGKDCIDIIFSFNCYIEEFYNYSLVSKLFRNSLNSYCYGLILSRYTKYTYLYNITNLYCRNNRKFTDKSLSLLTNLTHFDCGCNRELTDKSLSLLTNLTHFNNGNNHNFTNKKSFFTNQFNLS